MKFGEKIKTFFFKIAGNIIDDDLFDDLCDLLVEGDYGACESYKAAEELRKLRFKEHENPANLLSVKLSEYLFDELKKANPVKDITGAQFAAVLLLGVNGVGKTTTAAKLASYYNTQYNKKIILAAADTFRAAAIDQLKIHGEKLNMRVIAHKQGGDPAAVVYDALEAAKSGGCNIMIADTAGRMHTKSALVEELRKIDRVVETKASDALYLKYLVLDATTGRNAFSQAEIFHEAVNLDGVILTKYDSTAKGGVVFSLASSLNLPVVYICNGEKYSDIKVFDPYHFAKEFSGIA